ncbi:hypothetical protein BKA70DRAFT_1466541, partial [Coprinopsis sp. MPI-PUGE-AT-0042]
LFDTKYTCTTCQVLRVEVTSTFHYRHCPSPLTIYSRAPYQLHSSALTRHRLPSPMLSALSKRRHAIRRSDSTMSITNESSNATFSGPSSSSSTSAATDAAAKLIDSSSPSLFPARKRRDSIISITGIASSPQKASISPPVATKDTSDTASIRSVASVSGSISGKLRKRTLLSRFSSGAVETLASALNAGYTPPNPRPAVTASRPSTPLSESPKMQTVDLENLPSDEGFVDGGSDAGRYAAMVRTSASMQASGNARHDSSASTASGVLKRKTSSLEAVIIQSAVDKQLIKELEKEKAVLEKEKIVLVEEKENVLKENETLLKEMKCC